MMIKWVLWSAEGDRGDSEIDDGLRGGNFPDGVRNFA